MWADLAVTKASFCRVNLGCSCNAIAIADVLQDLLKKYIMYARQKFHPKLHSIGPGEGGAPELSPAPEIRETSQIREFLENSTENST